MLANSGSQIKQNSTVPVQKSDTSPDLGALLFAEALLWDKEKICCVYGQACG